MKKFPYTGERFIPTQTTPGEVIVNLERYQYVLPHIVNKRILELGCGCGLGTYLYSLAAEGVTGVDYDPDALEYATFYPFGEDKVRFQQLDLDKATPGGKYDVVVALEVLEHLENPKKLLEELDTKFLVFSLPLNSLAASTWHKLRIGEGEQGIKDIKALIEDKYRIEDFVIQRGNWVYGLARKKKSWI